MYYINLNKLVIEKNYHSEQFNFNIDKDIVSDEKVNLKDIYTAFDNAFNNFSVPFSSKELAAAFVVDIKPSADVNIDIDNESDVLSSFLTVVNIGLARFFSHFITSSVRERELRLDVPDNLKQLKCSIGLLKNAINNKTLWDSFKLIINYGHFSYILADEKEEMPATAPFVHSVEEAPNLKDEK